MKKIGVEESLTNIQDALTQQGYDVVQLHSEADAQNVDCCIVTGLNSNMLGIDDTSTKASVIEASGLSADEVLHELEQKLNGAQ
ncbi:YkuS family protein [Bacillus testis]|uniref:YkuS family protein n=1 Tax=Bacillus testis TaxID=1622072 RepID=UPI00067E89C4|nr:YkuS family protein [Bacillus testis]